MLNDKLHNLRHSLAHILASAVTEMFPKAKLGVGPVIENGFYYDFLLPRALTPEDLQKLEKRMRELVKQRLYFERQELSIKDAVKFFREKDQPFKVELIEDIAKHGTTVFKDILGEEGSSKEKSVESVSLYQTGKFTDLCRGGHVNNTSEIKGDSFKLEKVSGAYWRGDQNNPQMQRVYGLAFESKAELDAYLRLQEELVKRDHRVLGPKLGLFTFHDVSPGIPFYSPKGMILRRELEKFVREYSYGKGYSEVKTPQMFDSELFKTSGHWDNYRENMYTLEIEKKDFALKPMNCPGHMLMYKQSLYSYRDLPLRMAEMTNLFRNELSGALSGMTRVRSFGQDDCHIFLTPDQVSDEIADVLKKIRIIFRIFGMKIDEVYLSTKPELSLGTEAEWSKAETALSTALRKAKYNYEINPGDGAFYGPKIDMQVKDALGRKWQLATIQLDFQQPQRFGLEYIDEKGERKTPIVVHRAILGSFERFLGVMIEQYGGAFPLWLSPVQISVLSISKKQNKYAKDTVKYIEELIPGIRIELDDRDESIGKKIRETEMQKVPYMLIIGEKEMKAKKIAVRTRGNKDLGTMAIKKFAEKIQEEIDKKK
jgi:threonyl-tRNA synthetase